MSNSNHTRGFLPLGVSRKRSYDIETGPKPGMGMGAGTGPGGFKKPSRRIPPPPPPISTSSSAAAYPAKQLVELKPKPKPKPESDNRMLAANLAYNYISRGTLFGKRPDPAGAEAEAEFVYEKCKDGAGEKVSEEVYAEVVNLIKHDGTHIPGIVNPTQLARWLQQQM